MKIRQGINMKSIALLVAAMAASPVFATEVSCVASVTSYQFTYGQPELSVKQEVRMNAEAGQNAVLNLALPESIENNGTLSFLQTNPSFAVRVTQVDKSRSGKCDVVYLSLKSEDPVSGEYLAKNLSISPFGCNVSPGPSDSLVVGHWRAANSAVFVRLTCGIVTL